jgi:uncharacterized protein YecE (DUF72 family)
MNIKVGCCGFSAKREKYYKTFSVVELQQTFYKPPLPSTAEKWRKQAPENFEFTIKAFQIITHPPTSPTYRRLGYKPEKAGFFQPCKEVFDAWEKTKEIAEILKSRIIVFQTPNSFKDTPENMENMREFFSSVETKKFIFAWEPRGWSEDSIKKICKELNLVHVVDPFVSKPLHGKLCYFRLHGYPEMYKHKYTQSELKDLAKYVRGLKKEVYVMFNNIYMFEDALEFKKLIEGGG